jgi:hypothetical protein
MRRHERVADADETEPGPPMTLGNAAANHVRIIVWCKACQHQVELDPGEMAARYDHTISAQVEAPRHSDPLHCGRAWWGQRSGPLEGTERSAGWGHSGDLDARADAGSG